MSLNQRILFGGESPPCFDWFNERKISILTHIYLSNFWHCNIATNCNFPLMYIQNMLCCEKSFLRKQNRKQSKHRSPKQGMVNIKCKKQNRESPQNLSPDRPGWADLIHNMKMRCYLNPTPRFNGCERDREMFATFSMFLFQTDESFLISTLITSINFHIISFRLLIKSNAKWYN